MGGTLGETVVGEENQRELFVITLPQPFGGRPSTKHASPYKGLERLRFTCSAAAADEIERTLSRPNASIRPGAPRVYRGTRELAPPPADPSEELPTLEPMAGERDLQIAAQLRDAEGRLRKAEALCEAELRRLKSVQDEIEAAIKRRDVELEAQRDLLKKLRDDGLAEIERLNTHAREQQARAFDLDNKAQTFLGDAFDGLGKQARNVSQIREALGGGLFANRARDILLAGKDILEGVGDNPLVQVALAGPLAKMAARVTSATGEPTSPEDITASFLQLGRAYRLRRSQLAQFCATQPPAHPLCIALQTSSAYVAGELPWEAVLGLFGEASA